MDDYELQQALEAMAGAATVDEAVSEDIEATAQRWQRIFGLSRDEAIDRITQHRNDLSRNTVSDEHWSTVRTEKEVAGFDREAYEYELNLERHKANLASAIPVQDATSNIEYLVELKGPLSSIDVLCKAAGLDDEPKIVTGRSAETWEAVRLCCIDAKAKATLLRWATTDGRGYEPTILVNPNSMQ
ncbi:hypothetical protein AMS68_002165 [Peltaster fructicola]|uniref:Uncharacterized protein n=1 Tax=Peltaster fructicola TaxID=286661 RepID=A0A6H0XPT5_9PEZI|nr:hypothetical protein AMS68_002165 [Peltaster fructicola]